MKKNFFDLVNSNFFSIFVGDYKKPNYDILIRIKDKMSETNGTLDKESIVNLIQEYYDENPKYIINDEGEYSEWKRSPGRTIKVYEDAGWLMSEITNDFRIVYQLDPFALDLISAMEKSVNNDEKPLEPTGYVHMIYDACNHFDMNRATEITEQINTFNEELNKNLNNVNSKIKKYLNSLLKKDDKRASEILKELLIDYQENVVSRSFNNLRKKDNPSKYKENIIDKLLVLRNENMDELVSNYINVKFNGEVTENNLHEARTFFFESYNNVIKTFRTINDKIDVLDEKNSNYVSAARGRITFLLNDRDDVAGKVDNILRELEYIDINDDEDSPLDEFNLFELERIDDTSLYVYQKVAKTSESFAPLVYKKLDPELEKERKEAIIRQNKFTIGGIDKFILSLLKDKDEISLKEIEVNDLDEFIMLFLARIYSNSKIIHYEILDEEGTFSYNENEIRSYKIRRKK